MSERTEKECLKCHFMLPMGAFGSYTDKKRGKRYPTSYCKKCRSKDSAGYNRISREKKAPKWSEERVENVRSLAATGKSAKEIAEGLAVTRNVIISLCRRNGVKLIGKPAPPRPQIRIDWSDKDQIIKAEYASTKGSGLAARLGLTLGQLRGRARRLGAIREPRDIGKLRARAVELRRDGLRYSDIAATLGWDVGGVAKACLSHDDLRGVRIYVSADRTHIKVAPLGQLEERIVKPGFDKHLTPLLHFKGRADLGVIHRWWNFLVVMREAECESIEDGISGIAHNPAYSHLCGPYGKPAHLGLRSFTSRIQLTPTIKDLDPDLFDYAHLINQRPFDLSRVSAEAHRRGHAWWRHYVGRPDGKRILKPKEHRPKFIDYPFLIHDGGKPEHDLLRAVNSAVPKHLPPDLRADICQDIIVGILSGDFDRDNLTLPAKEMTRRVMKMFPTKYGPLSLDAPIPGTDGLRLIDTI